MQLAGGAGAPEHSQGARLPRQRMGVLEDIAERPPSLLYAASAYRRAAVSASPSASATIAWALARPCVDSRLALDRRGGDPARRLHVMGDEQDAAKPFLEEAIAVGEAVGDRLGVALAQLRRGVAVSSTGESDGS